MNGTRLTGHWQRVFRKLQKAQRGAKGHLHKTVMREAVRLSDNIKLNLTQSGQLIGKPFLPNAEATIQRKKSSKPLIDSGDLRNAIMPHRLDSKRILVGIGGQARGKHSKSKGVGAYVAHYARVQEFGAVVTSKSGKAVWIPARPFLRPVAEYTRNQRCKRLKKQLHELFQG